MTRSGLTPPILLALLLWAGLAVPAAAEPLPYWDLAPLHGPGQLTLFNPTANDGENGVPVRSVDLNGDGRDEVVVSGIRGDGPQNGPFRDSAGEVHITFWGDEPLEGFIDFLNPHPKVLEILGAQPFDYLGVCLSPGDLDDDGLEDLVIGAFGGDGPARLDAGRCYVLFGDSTMTGGATIDLALGLPSNMSTVLGTDPDERLGIWTSVGDFDNDGSGDLLVGADRAAGPGGGRDFAGKAYIVYGPLPRGAEIDLLTWPRTTVIWGLDADDHFGATVTSGDYDDDGFDDAVIAAASHNMSRNVFDNGGSGDGPPYSLRIDSGETWIVFGDSALPDTIDLLAPPGGVSTSVVYGRHQGARAGEELDTADINGDNIDDLLIGALATRGPPFDYRLNAGEGYVYLGSAGIRDQVFDLGIPNSYPRITLYGIRSSIMTDSFTSGDINNDGYDDMLVGLPCATGPSLRWGGYIVVVYGSATPPAEVDIANPQMPITLLEGADFDDNTAYWASSGDVDGDGFVDVIVNSMTSSSYRNSRPVAGEARAVSGSWLTRHPQPPVDPRVLANQEPGTVELTWDPSPSSGVTGYRVEWKAFEDRQGGSMEVPGLTAEITRLPNGVPHEFQVLALIDDRPSRAGDPLVATPGTVPTPSDLAATVAGRNEVDLTWDPVPDSDVIGYLVYRWLDGQETTPDQCDSSFFCPTASFTDVDAPPYQGVHYAVAAVRDRATPSAREVDVSDPTGTRRVFPRPLSVGYGILLTNDYDWSIHSDRQFTQFFGDPWEMYRDEVVTGGHPHTFWDLRDDFFNYPPGVVPAGTGPLDPDLLFNNGVFLLVFHAPDDDAVVNILGYLELLLEFEEAGGSLVILGRLMGTYLPDDLAARCHVLDWDSPVIVSPATPLLSPTGAWPAIPSIPGVPGAVLCDVPEFDGDETIRILAEGGSPESPLFFAVDDPPGFPRHYFLSASPSFLDPSALKIAMGALLQVLPKAGLATGLPGESPGAARVGLPFPNPFSSGVRVSFTLETRGEVNTDVIDVTGRRVRRINGGMLPEGAHSVSWDGRDDRGLRTAAGIYFMRITSPEFTATRRVLLVR